ncbi:MAG: hypothetical protein ACP5E5_11550 [Acidobacteriaceae bacterium]
MKMERVNLGKKGSFEIKKGALHEQLGIPLGETIPEEVLKAAEHSKDGLLRRRAIAAEGFRRMRHVG